MLGGLAAEQDSHADFLLLGHGCSRDEVLRRYDA
jgi:hypothetical protein